MQKNKRPDNAIGVWCITPNGMTLAEQLAPKFTGSVIFASEKLRKKAGKKYRIQYFNALSDEINRSFGNFRKHVFIFSVGIAVRMIGQLLESKLTDPAVVVVDDKGTFAVSLVSGHLGGANELAQKTGKILNAQPVITTATDANDLPAIDNIAKESGCHIETPENIKRINMAILCGKKISIYDPENHIKPMLQNIYPQLQDQAKPEGADIYCSHGLHAVPRETMILRPADLYVGIGCNRGTSCDQIREFVLSVFAQKGLSADSIAGLATTDAKSDEKGLLEFAEELGIELVFHGKDALNSAIGVQNPSEMAEKYLGVKSVSEAAAILSSSSGRLIIEKQKNKDVTVAVAVKR